jgi:hypothetical protein
LRVVGFGFKFLFERSTYNQLETGYGAREKWEGEAPAEPKRQRIATGER